MNDQELRQLLGETAPVLPGQEVRAWMQLREKLKAPPARHSLGQWFFTPSWTLTAALVIGTAVFISLGDWIVVNSQRPGLASADSQSPGIFATAFYSHAAKAQVVWLDGMEPISGRPTYLDPTTSDEKPSGTQPPADPYSL